MSTEVEKVSATVVVSQDLLRHTFMPDYITRAIAVGILGYDPQDSRTPEQRELDRVAWAAETQRIQAAVREKHADVIAQHSGKALAVLELHAPTFYSVTDRCAHCDGCDFGGYEAESPEWPCRTYELLTDPE